MRDKDGNYPVGYNGDKNGAGNRLYIGSNIDGEDIMVGYWHLLVDNPIAINPRTGMPFKSGDKVYQGEIIAYSGRTGNASNPNEVPYAHLHLVVKKDNIYVNPELYINGKLNSHGVDMQKIVSTTEINNIILNITQTNLFGNSILETMYNQIEFLRDKEILEIKGQINKIPNKISIVSVLFVLPLILLIILGPYLITFLS